MKMKKAATTLAITVAAVGGIGVGHALAQHNHSERPAPAVTITPTEMRVPATVTGCEQEDSCQIDYANKVWRIWRETP